MIVLKRRTFLLLIIIIGFIFVLASCAVPKSAVSKTGDTRFHNSIYYIGTEGKVGHHMYAEARAKCSITWNYSSVKIVSGTLPAGLTMDGYKIQGTPTQPGKWTLRIKFTKPTCNEKTYPDQTVQVNFYIEGIAPKRLK